MGILVLGLLVVHLGRELVTLVVNLHGLQPAVSKGRPLKIAPGITALKHLTALSFVESLLNIYYLATHTGPSRALARG
jgi:hypothetical protein